MRIVVLVALSLLAGCAAAPQTEAPAAEAAAMTSPAPAVAAAAPAPTTPAAPAAANDAAEEKFTPPAGYKARVENGQTTYCRKITVLGSRFAKDVCMTEAQLREQEANNATFGRDKDQASRVCAGGGACQAM